MSERGSRPARGRGQPASPGWRWATLAVLVCTGSHTWAATYHVDSQLGQDDWSGTAAAGTAGGAGPWRSLARLAQASLQPGDEVVLACGSVWHETLTLRGQGTASRPIRLRAADGPCAERPTVDGSQRITPAAWRTEPGGLVSAALDRPALQVHGGAPWHPAHHPNLASAAEGWRSPYLPMAGDGDTVQADGRRRGTSLVAAASRPGADAMPAASGEPRPLAGALVRVRTNAWAIEDRRITAAGADGRLQLDAPTVYPPQAGWGYYLLGLPWMLDSPGEWLWQPGPRRLLAWRPAQDLGSDVHVTVLGTGLDLRHARHVQVSGLAVRRVGTGVQAQGSQGLRLADLVVEDTADHGIAAAASTGLQVLHGRISRTGLDAIAGGGSAGADAQGLQVSHTTIQDSGVLWHSGRAHTLPRRSFAAIYAGTGAVVAHNQISHAGYIGIRHGPGSRIEHNDVQLACLVLDDCGAIYTWGQAPNGSTVQANRVSQVPGNNDGKPPGVRTAAQGIYLDDHTTGVTVADNSVSGADNGIQVHDAFGNTVVRNLLHGNRRSQLWLHETGNSHRDGGDLRANHLADNLLVASWPGSLTLHLQTAFDSTAHFGHFQGNWHWATAGQAAVLLQAGSQAAALVPAAWAAGQGGGPRPVDEHAPGAPGLPAPWAQAAGANLLAPATPAPASANGAGTGGSLGGWAHWSPGPAPGQLLRQPCAGGGHCLAYRPGNAAGQVSTPHFSVSPGQWYRLTVDLKGDTDGQTVTVSLRRGGGSQGQGYGLLADRQAHLATGPAWQRHSMLFLATSGVRQADPRTGDHGARIDFSGLGPGRGLQLRQAELVPVLPPTGPAGARAALLANPGTTASPMPCPWADAGTAHCNNLLDAATGLPLRWPLVLQPAEQRLVLRTRLPGDSDADGIPDAADRCPLSPTGSPANAAGCTLGQTP